MDISENAQVYLKEKLGSFDCLNKNALLGAALSSQGILVNEKMRHEFIDKLERINAICGLYVVKYYNYYKYYQMKSKLGDIDRYKNYYESKQYKWINALGDNRTGKFIITFLLSEFGDNSEDSFYGINLNKLSSWVVDESTLVDFRNYIEDLASKSEVEITSIADVIRKRSIYPIIENIFSKELDFSYVREYNKSNIENGKLLIKLYNIRKINESSSKKYSINEYDKAVEEFTGESRSLLSNGIELKDLGFIDNIADSICFKTQLKYFINNEQLGAFIDNKFSEFIDLVSMIRYYTEWNKLRSLPDINVLNYNKNDKIPYGDQFLSYDEVVELVNSYNMNSPEIKEDIWMACKSRDKDLTMKLILLVAEVDKLEISGQDITEITSPAKVKEFLETIDLSKVDKDKLEEAGYSYNSPKTHFPFSGVRNWLHPDNRLKELIISEKDEIDQLTIDTKYLFCYNTYNTTLKQLSGYLKGQLEGGLEDIYKIEDDGFIVTGKNPEFTDYTVYIPSFKVNGVNTKRWSGGIQTWKQGTDVFRLLEAEKDHVAIYFDISQAEVRVAAFMSGDKNLIDMYKSGKDMYVELARLAYPGASPGILMDKRQDFKAVVLGILYGRGSYSIADTIGTGVGEAKRLVKTFKSLFPTLTEFIEEKKKYAAENARIDTVLGDRLSCDPDRSSTVGINWVVQEFASVMLAEGFWNLVHTNYKIGRRLLPKIVVHDSFTVTTHAKNFFKVLEDIEVNFRDYIINKYGIPLKYDLITMVNFRDKNEIKFDKESGILKLSGNEIGIDSWLNVIRKYHDIEVIESETEESDGSDFVGQLLGIGWLKTSTFYPDNEFRPPVHKKVKLKIK